MGPPDLLVTEWGQTAHKPLITSLSPDCVQFFFKELLAGCFLQLAQSREDLLSGLGWEMESAHHTKPPLSYTTRTALLTPDSGKKTNPKHNSSLWKFGT